MGCMEIVIFMEILEFVAEMKKWLKPFKWINLVEW